MYANYGCVYDIAFSQVIYYHLLLFGLYWTEPTDEFTWKNLDGEIAVTGGYEAKIEPVHSEDQLDAEEAQQGKKIYYSLNWFMIILY